ncbi:MAG TPA: hypothetical protein VLT51_07985 [Anaerolineales bacterium]|nr:hypothetical protein [Anaerolineales bacterium]
MNLRCSFCQTPFTIGRIEKLDALQHMDANNLSHYDAHCPRCRRATPVLRQKLEMTMPNWRDALKELEKEMSAHPQKEAPLPQHTPAPVPQIESKPSFVSAQDTPQPAPQAEAIKEKPVPTPKTEAKAKPARKTSSPKSSKTTTAKPAAAKKPAKPSTSKAKPAAKKPAAKKKSK